MRRLAPVCFALLGVAVAVPTGVRAGVPDNCLTCNGQPIRNQDMAKCKHKVRKVLCSACRAAARAERDAASSTAFAEQAPHGRHLCAKCMANAYPGMTVQGVEGVAGTVGANVPCTACQAGAQSAPVYVTQGGAPGYATLNGGPGYTVLSATVVSSDPAPIGVMRTSFSQNETREAPGFATVGPAGSSPAGGQASSGRNASLASGMNFVTPPRPQRPHVLRHLFGLDGFGRRRQMREEQRTSAHAAIRYDQPNETVTELPASLVYGPKR